MTKAEKVIEGLTQVILHLDVMWQISSGEDELRYRQLRDYAEDALGLLKEQKPLKVLQDRRCKVTPTIWQRKGFCPECHQEVQWITNRKFCGYCGQAVKWDD